MVRKRVSMSRENVIEVNISGPKSIIPEPTVIQVDESQTWLDVLNGDLRLKVPQNKGIFVCSTKYCPSRPRPGEGWRADLTDTVANFVAGFERKRPQYRVRICHPYDITSYNTNVAPKRNLVKPIVAPVNKMPPPPPPLPGRPVVGVRRPNIVVPVQGVPKVNGGIRANPKSTGQPAQPRKRPAAGLVKEALGSLQNLRSIKVEVAEEEEEWNEPWDEVPSKVPRQEPERQESEEFNDNDSLCTALSEQEEEFVRDGIEVRDVKRLAVSKLSKVSNAVLLRIEKEIESLKDSNKWQRNVLRSPLTCWLVQELFRE